ncbi:oxygenase MpaB family protein [Streptomyces sp. NPDC088258]|uniref:oxygenase MpaB family protein n=1 Tax=Streptomyces sp. NPDC088258 TaxID=3365849 RepID=UPI0038065148
MNDIPGRPDPGTASGALPLPGPDSIAWRYVGQWRLLTVLGRALVLETAHPVVGSGVEAFSTYRYHPWRRAQQTLLSLQRVVYLDVRGREKEAARLVRLHRHIKGVDGAGRSFDALDPEAKAWVHLTLFEAIVTMCRVGGDPLPARDEEQLYEEWRACGRVIGLDDDVMPADVAAFWVYFERMTRERLDATGGLRGLVSALSGDFPPPAQLDFLPAPLWRAVRGAAARAYLDMTAALLSPALRERLDLRPGPAGPAIAAVVCRAAGLLDRIAPPRLRYMPVAATAIAAELQLRRSLARRAARPDAAVPELFDRILDQTGDGFVSWADLAAVARVVAVRLEVDEATETALYDAFHTWWLELRAGSDTDGDGLLSREEYARTGPDGAALRAAMDTVAAAVDRDGDGFVEQAEYAHLLGGGGHGPELLESFRLLDTDGDGRVTVAEFAAGLGAFFAGRAGSPVGRRLLGRA